jgi:NTP pyrophosphatase (non-canonical NTP hydrolase)
MATSWPQDIAKMHEKYGFDKMSMTDLNKDFLNFRAKFLQEELNEIYSAIDNNNPEEVVDGLIDLCVVAIGTLDLYGVDAQVAWEEVYMANMKKSKGIKPGREESGGWDLVKDKNWHAPIHEENTGCLHFTLSGEEEKPIVQIEMFESCEPECCGGIHVEDFAETYAMETLRSCIVLQKCKGSDYQNPKSTVRQADHYPRGVATLYDMVHQKMIRIKSLMETAEAGGTLTPPNFESIVDSAMDAINYLSFMVSYTKGAMDGQAPYRDMFNRER